MHNRYIAVFLNESIATLGLLGFAVACKGIAGHGASWAYVLLVPSLGVAALGLWRTWTAIMRLSAETNAGKSEGR
jgi:hypothetical protein